MNKITLHQGHAPTVLRTMPPKSVHCVVTSPPYWGLRDYRIEAQVWGGGEAECGHEWGDFNPSPMKPYGNQVPQTKCTNTASADGQNVKAGQFCLLCGAWRGSYGLEPTIDLYVQHTVEIFREVRRVLRSDGVLFLNLGDTYNGGKGRSNYAFQTKRDSKTMNKEHSAICSIYGETRPADMPQPGLKPKDLVGVPWRVALALQADGWWLRSDIIWCLSGGTWLYVRTQKGDMPMMVRDVARLDPTTVKLWNGKKWTRLLGVSQSPRQGDEIELVLRSGERISCTPTHQWPTSRGLLPAADIQVGDVLESAYLPEPEKPKDCALDEDAAWFAGLYIAEGSKAGDTIQIAGHSKETDRLERVERIAAKFGGAATVTVAGNKQDIRVYGKVLNAILDELVTGHMAKNKGFAPVVWRYSNRFIAAMVDGYLSGDGHWDEPNNRWRLGFTRNYNLERDLRVACARLGYRLSLKPASVKYDGRMVPTFKGEIRKSWGAHHNQKQQEEVVEIRKARCRNVYDLGVEDAPHLFALASGVLTHNSKPNPMPESCTDRPTRAHEYIFLLTKSAKYFYDAEAIREQVRPTTNGKCSVRPSGDSRTRSKENWGVPHEMKQVERSYDRICGANCRSVWEIATEPFPSAHFATFPQRLVERCIKAGTSERGCCPRCGSPWRRVVEKKASTMNIRVRDSKKGIMQHKTPGFGATDTEIANYGKEEMGQSTTTGWVPTCKCPHSEADVVPCVCLDPFSGAGTTALVAAKLGRGAIGIELKPEYIEMAANRLRAALGMLAEVEVIAPEETPLSLPKTEDRRPKTGF